MRVEGRAHFAASTDGAALFLDRSARTLSTMAAALRAKPWPGMYYAWIVFGPSGRLDVLRLALP
jgi:hypothetical protein